MTVPAQPPLTAEEVVELARSRPWADRPWARELLDSFPGRLAQVTARWQLTIERAHLEGAGLPVLDVHCAGSHSSSRRSPAVVKFDGVGADLPQQARVLEAADGHGFVRLLEYDAEAGAMLLERLGPTLWREAPDPIAQTDHIADLLEQAWQLPLDVGLPFTPDQQARSLLSGIENALGTELGAGTNGAPVSDRVRTLQRAQELAQDLAVSPSSTQVVVHGDPHASNVLRRGEGFAFIDPDGFRCEPEYDAGVALRDQQGTIDDLERHQSPGAGRRWHQWLTRRLATRLELDPERVAAWAFVERVTTGLHLKMLGYADEGESWLATADRLAV